MRIVESCSERSGRIKPYGENDVEKGAAQSCAALCRATPTSIGKIKAGTKRPDHPGKFIQTPNYRQPAIIRRHFPIPGASSQHPEVLEDRREHLFLLGGQHHQADQARQFA
jgi:hypothetical protein